MSFKSKRMKVTILQRDILWADPKSNVQFGEGGAGTFSDGKLTTGIKDSLCKTVIEELYLHGAKQNILYDAKPHIGTDILVNVVKNANNTVDMSAYENGVYFFNIVDNAGQSALQRVVVAK